MSSTSVQHLCRKTEREFGPKFDIRSFHGLSIGSGSLPLTVLEPQVDAWIAARRRA